MTLNAYDPDGSAHRNGHGAFGRRAIPASVHHVLDICFEGDVVCDLDDSFAGALAEAFQAQIHMAYPTFGWSFGMLTPTVGSIVARMAERG